MRAAAREMAECVDPPAARSSSGRIRCRDPVARVVKVVVAFILDPLLALRRQIGSEVLVCDIKKRPDHSATPRIDPPQAGEAGASHQLEQEGFGLVIPRVANGHPIRADVGGHTLEEGVAEAPSRVLDGKGVRLRLDQNIRGFDDDRQAKPLREMPAERLIPLSRRPESMIEMRQADHGELAVLREIQQQPRQGHRVRSAGQPNQDARAGRRERIPADGAPNLLMDPSQDVVPEGGLEPPTPRL